MVGCLDATCIKHKSEAFPKNTSHLGMIPVSVYNPSAPLPGCVWGRKFGGKKEHALVCCMTYPEMILDWEASCSWIAEQKSTQSAFGWEHTTT